MGPEIGFFGMLVIGLIAGYVAEKVTASDHGLLTNLLVGIAGSFVGGTLAQQIFGFDDYGFWGAMLIATLGAILLLFVWRRIRS